MTEQEQLAIRSAAHSWMKHQGYTDDDIAVAETDTHEASGCEWCPNHMTWDCIDEVGQSRHPAWDALDDAVQVVQFLGDLGYRKPREITTIEELDALHVDTLIVASGTYLRGKGEFYDCWAIPVPNYISGTAERTWWVMVHGDDWASSLTTTSRITEARVLYTPESGGAE